MGYARIMQENSMQTISEIVKGNKAVFIRATGGNLWYRTTGTIPFEFPVPYEDVGTAEFKAEHNALELMRWIRKWLEEIKESKAES